MPVLAAFAALRYDSAVVGDLAKVVAPPYDVISPAEQDALYRAHPQNVVRLILAKDSDGADRYASAARDLSDWRARGILKLDPTPALYPYEQRFTLATGEEHTRAGFIALVRLEDPGKGVKPHERTLAAPLEDRFRLMSATHANLSQIFAIFRDPAREVDAALSGARGEPVAQARTADGIQHAMWRVTDPAVIAAVAKRLREEPLIIADGHHRYETALRYRAAQRTLQPSASPRASFEYVPMFLCNTADPGLVILPTHRMLRSAEGFDVASLRQRLEEHFHLIERPVPPPTPMGARLVARLLADVAAHGPSFAVVSNALPSMILATVKPKLNLDEIPSVPAAPALRGLDVTALHTLCLERLVGLSAEAVTKGGAITYVKDTAEALRLCRAGEVAAGFLLPSTRIEQVAEVAEAGERMPQKSTFFYPKILSGLVLRPIEEGAVVAEP
jgi:uncharacterized protein (DUF1015 family)